MKLDSNSSIKESKFHNINNIAVDIGGVIYTEDRTDISLEGSEISLSTIQQLMEEQWPYVENVPSKLVIVWAI